MTRHPLGCTALALLVFGTLLCTDAGATQKWGPVQLSGNLQSQNLIRHPDASTFEYIQNRNTVHLRLDYDWLQGGRFYNKYDIPFIESSHFFLLWRGVYDSIYDTTPGFFEDDIKQRAYPFNGKLLKYADFAKLHGVPTCALDGSCAGKAPFVSLGRHQINLSSLSDTERGALAVDNQLREMYADIKMRGIPLTARIGRQQVVWGETDNFRMLDRANPLDLTWHFQQEIPAPAFGWDEIRRPLWMAKFLYDLGDVWKISQSFLEWYWNPGDWYPAKQAFLPRPWGLRFYNPLTNVVDGAFFDGPCLQSSHKVPNGPRAGEGQCVRLLHNTRLFEQGNYSRWDPLDNSQVGLRYHGIAPFGLEFTLNYFYQRWAGDDGTNYAPLKGINRTFVKRGGRFVETPATQAHDQMVLNTLTQKGTFPAEAYTPYVHTLGASANYSDETFTQTVYRVETVYDIGVPFFDVGKPTVIDTPALPGVTRKNMWKGMIAFDRPTWVRWVNKKSTVFFTGQFFFHYLVNNPKCDAASVAAESPVARKNGGSCLAGGLDLPSSVRTPGIAPVFRDKIRDWETLATFAAFTFYRGGSIVPVLGLAVDTTNHYNMEPFWTIDYFVTGSVAVNLAQRYFFTPQGHSTPIFETWGLSGLNAGRSETSIRLTYQF